MAHDHTHQPEIDIHFFNHHGDEDFLGSSESGEDGEVNTWLLDNVELTTVGVDVGSSTSHLVFSRLHLQRLAQSLSSRFVVVERKELHRSPILLTPFTSESTIDLERLSDFVNTSYKEAGVDPSEVDTGVVILTGVALERRNARAVAELFASHGGKFVCASAGHNLEGLLAAHGSGAVALSRKKHSQILHIDIGGGTSKLALIEDGEILETSAISIGARLLAFDDEDRIVRIESAAFQIAESLGIELQLGAKLSQDQKQNFANTLAEILLSFALHSQMDNPLIADLTLTPAISRPPRQDAIFTFSGGVSEYLFGREKQVYNDMAMLLSQAIQDKFSQNNLSYSSAGEGIRATAIGASQFTVQLSGNTIMVTNGIELPLHNLPVISPKLTEAPTSESVSSGIITALTRLDLLEFDTPICVYLPWKGDAEYSILLALASGIKDAIGNRLEQINQPLVLALEVDMGAALGRILTEELGQRTPVVSIDGVELRELDFVDIGEPLEPTKVLPVMVKSLAFPVVNQVNQ